MPLDVNNKSVLVTGANRGIGKAILEEALKRGAARVYAAVRDLDSAKPLVAEHGDRVVPVRLDLGDPDSITSAAATATDVNVVVNNAGVLEQKTPLDSDSIETLQFEMNTNVYRWRLIEPTVSTKSRRRLPRFLTRRCWGSMSCASPQKTDMSQNCPAAFTRPIFA